MELILYFYDIRLYINCVFCFGWKRTLVAIAIYIFHRLIIGKVENDIFSVSTGIFGKKNTEMLILYEFCPNT